MGVGVLLLMGQALSSLHRVDPKKWRRLTRSRGVMRQSSIASSLSLVERCWTWLQATSCCNHGTVHG